MGDVFINLSALMLCIVIFKSKEKRDKKDVWILFGMLFIHRLQSGECGWEDVEISQSRFWNNRMVPL